MAIICKECGFENEDGEKQCAMCGSQLGSSVNINTELHREPEEIKTTVHSSAAPVYQDTPNEQSVHSDNSAKYFVNCENSRTKTYVSGHGIKSFFCNGCHEEHPIDGFFWTVQKEEETEEKPVSDTSGISADSGKKLVLEEIETHFQIEIGAEGGVLGRYGTIGAAYFQNHPKGRMVSGEHCKFRYEYGRWSVEHLSRTNDTVFNSRKLEQGYEEAVRDGKMLTLANAISFIVRIV